MSTEKEVKETLRVFDAVFKEIAGARCADCKLFKRGEGVTMGLYAIHILKEESNKVSANDLLSRLSEYNVFFPDLFKQSLVLLKNFGLIEIDNNGIIVGTSSLVNEIKAINTSLKGLNFDFLMIFIMQLIDEVVSARKGPSLAGESLKTTLISNMGIKREGAAPKAAAVGSDGAKKNAHVPLRDEASIKDALLRLKRSRASKKSSRIVRPASSVHPQTKIKRGEGATVEDKSVRGAQKEKLRQETVAINREDREISDKKEGARGGIERPDNTSEKIDKKRKTIIKEEDGLGAESEKETRGQEAEKKEDVKVAQKKEEIELGEQQEQTEEKIEEKKEEKKESLEERLERLRKEAISLDEGGEDEKSGRDNRGDDTLTIDEELGLEKILTEPPTGKADVFLDEEGVKEGGTDITQQFRDTKDIEDIYDIGDQPQLGRPQEEKDVQLSEKRQRDVSAPIPCPQCGRPLSHEDTKSKKAFYFCDDVNCGFSCWGRPFFIKCPKCKSPYMLEAETSEGKLFLECPTPTCFFTRPHPEKAGKDNGKKRRIVRKRVVRRKKK